MTTDELTHWIAFARGSPIGDDRMDHLIAQLCLLVCNVGGAKRRGGGQFSMDDFLMFKPKDFTTPLQFLQGRFAHRIVQRKRDKG